MTYSTKTNIQLVSIGIIGYLFIGNIAQLIKSIIKDFLVALSLKPIITISIVEALYLIIFILGMLYLFKSVNGKIYKFNKTLTTLVIGFVTANILQFLEPIVFQAFAGSNYYDNLSNLLDFQKENQTLMFWFRSEYVLIDLSILFIIYRQIKNTVVNKV